MARNIFNSVKMTRPKKNNFDLTHDVKMSGKMGYLYPCLTMECVPGDKVHLGCDALVRFAPMLAPIMHRVDMTVHYFFVPNRLLWDNWEKFIVNDVSNPVHPYFVVTNTFSAAYQKFMDYFGIPPQHGGGSPLAINALPFYAYQKIYNDYYRDENLKTVVVDKAVDGDNIANLGFVWQIRKRAFEHDYFTASLPFVQKGADVSIPLGDITLDPDSLQNNGPDGNRPAWYYWAAGKTALPTNYAVTADTVTSGIVSTKGVLAPNPDINKVVYDPDGSLVVNPTTINDLRRAIKLQEWFERNARGGTRYVEHILAHFGVRSPDKRLQRAEYITGIKSPVVISEVLNTTGPQKYFNGADPVDMGNPQGSMAGHGVSVAAGKSGSYFCEEHGIIMGILSIMPKTAYQNGVPKMYLKNSFLDYYFPSFAHLGEQEVKNAEVYAYTANDQHVFGYVPRYAEYKYMPSRVAGDFRSTLDFWHLGRKFAGLPPLNGDFIEPQDADFNRIFAVQDGSDNVWMHLLHRIHAIRPMPRYGEPSI